MSSLLSHKRSTAPAQRQGTLRLVTVLAGGTLALAGCSMSGMDWDLRPSDRFSTSQAAQQATAARPQPDANGVISYPGYQVVVARRGETVAGIAQRLGMDPGALARHNAIEPTTTMRGGELLVLPGRVTPQDTTITATPLTPPMPEGPEPTRHTVRRGETAFSIARLHQVSPRSLAEWNGLDAQMNVREGQILVIPVAEAAAVGAPLSATGMPAAPEPHPMGETTSLPGQGSPTPVPPSAADPLPDSNPAPAGLGGDAAGQPAEPVANMAEQRSDGPQLAMPVQGRIIRAYARGSNDGIGIGAPAGTSVNAAASGTVAAITRDTDQVPILVIRHENNLLTVYANIDEIRVSRGDRVTRGQAIASVRAGDPSFLHFEVREGLESVDPMPYLQ